MGNKKEKDRKEKECCCKNNLSFPIIMKEKGDAKNKGDYNLSCRMKKGDDRS